ncbi:Vancomycin resistance protein YoaR, contains peptidoglycan-binding and VanW domains [Sanguibacter gelidistatuariae]|uniref:Vancomycin resistance protein YoaR, contains peptidoglycan-binding and VanW domains n=1 Tax=Sanguibacter gelidistatuariae TaxID=1814289 RepID=A0A1G6MDX1_9MICO|nr:VanW family protein [Sanguibacter gelidistatuariae]SDC53762.1 Vancomycin resistance protein YoaR, contains peptidoglycan-binding and VanW domains [Sanguibacter gelidistatuariae]
MTSSADETTPVPQSSTAPPPQPLDGGGTAAPTPDSAPWVQRNPSGIAVQGLSYPVLQRPPVETPTEALAATPTDPTAAATPAAGSSAGDSASPTDPATSVLPTIQDEIVPAQTTTETLQGEPGSPLSVFDADDSGRRWPKVLLWTGIGLVVAAGAYVGAQWHFADRIPRGTTVAGVDIGGLSSDDAVARLTTELGGISTAPIPVTAGEAATTIDPVSAGLTFDAAATVEGLTEFTLAPGHLLAQISGGREIDPVTVVDATKLAVATDLLATDLAVPATSGTVGFVDGGAVQTPAADGTALDEKQAADVVTSGWLSAARPIDLPTTTVEPEITQAETDAAFGQAQQVAASSVSVTVAGQVAEIPVANLTAAATFTSTDGDLVLAFDGTKLVQDVIDRTTALLANSSDATFVFVDNAPVIQPGVPGTTLDPATLAAAVQKAALSDVRSAEVELVPSDPAQSTQALEALGVTAKVSEFATPLTNEPDRTENLRIAAEKITGVLVKPGETFSLTEAIGPFTRENGYKDAHIIVNGNIVEGVGGGLSQMSTTTYNAGFFAGMVDVEHQPHSYWFTRYPEGREATLYDGQIDMRWRNDSPYGVLLQSWIADGKLNVAVWSTPYYTVETTTSARSGVVAPTTEHRTGASCAPQSMGGGGFSVSVWRKVTITATGEETINETNKWRYRPQNAVVCDG